MQSARHMGGSTWRNRKELQAGAAYMAQSSHGPMWHAIAQSCGYTPGLCPAACQAGEESGRCMAT
eukprot:scaffold133439_cov20-Tisochrysis_lutea.AAC.2